MGFQTKTFVLSALESQISWALCSVICILPLVQQALHFKNYTKFECISPPRVPKICHLVSCFFFAAVKKDRALHSHSVWSAKVIKSIVSKHWPLHEKRSVLLLYPGSLVCIVVWIGLKDLFCSSLLVWSLLNIHYDPPVFSAPNSPPCLRNGS